MKGGKLELIAIFAVLFSVILFSVWANDRDWRLTPRFSFEDVKQDSDAYVKYEYGAFGFRLDLMIDQSEMVYTIYTERFPEKTDITIQDTALFPRLLSVMEENHFDYLKSKNYDCFADTGGGEGYQSVTIVSGESSYSTRGICGIPDEFDAVVQEIRAILVEYHDGDLGRWIRYE